jgi:hypothetical protein
MLSPESEWTSRDSLPGLSQYPPLFAAAQHPESYCRSGLQDQLFQYLVALHSEHRLQNRKFEVVDQQSR